MGMTTRSTIFHQATQYLDLPDVMPYNPNVWVIKVALTAGLLLHAKLA